MPEGSIFGDEPVDSAVVMCRAPATKKVGWDMPCLLKTLCKKDKDVIDHVRTKVDLYKVDRVYFEDNYFDGKNWTVKTFEAGGTNSSGEITMLSKTDCATAATTIYHETWHDKQPADMGWPHPAEDDAYYNTEAWTIERGLPGQQGSLLRTKDAKGKTIVDKAAVKDFVEHEYPVQTTASPDWRIVDIDKSGNQTRWRNRKTGDNVWKASAKGDTLDGPQITKGKVLIDPKTIKCP